MQRWYSDQNAPLVTAGIMCFYVGLQGISMLPFIYHFFHFDDVDNADGIY